MARPHQTGGEVRSRLIMSLPKKNNSRQHLSFKTLDGLMGYHLKRVTGEMLSQFPDHVDGLKLKPSEFAVLSMICDNDGIRAADICECLNFQQPNLVKILNRFAQEGWVSRQPDPEDGRAVILAVTQSGKELAQAVKSAALDSEKSLLKKLNSEEKKQLNWILKKLYL